MEKNNSSLHKIIEHPDKDEILSKLILDYEPKEINDWLKQKYINVSEKKFVISEKTLINFKKNYLDIYKTIQDDLQKSREAVAMSDETNLELTVQNLPAYKKVMLNAANEELDIRKIIKNLCVAIEMRLAQVFDEIQEDPRNINTRIDRLLIDYTEVLGNILEKYYKFTEAPENVTINNNITLQTVDQHISVFHDVIRDVLKEMDFDTSLYFIEVFNNKFKELKNPENGTIISSSERLAEAEILNETINKKLNG